MGLTEVLDYKYAPFIQVWMTRALAVARREKHWIAAWLAENGLWVAESDDLSVNEMRPSLGGTLLTGDAGGVVIKLTGDGEQLLLLQTAGFGNPISVRLFDLRRSWIDELKKTGGSITIDRVRQIACNIVSKAGDSHLDEFELKMFGLENRFSKPCGNT
jgi:hypothetical protein